MSTGFELQQAALESVRFGIRVERARSTAGAATSPCWNRYGAPLRI